MSVVIFKIFNIYNLTLGKVKYFGMSCKLATLVLLYILFQPCLIQDETRKQNKSIILELKEE